MKRLMAVSELSDQKVVASHREKVDQEVKVDLAVEEAGVEEHVDVVVVELEVDSQLESGNLSVIVAVIGRKLVSTLLTFK